MSILKLTNIEIPVFLGVYDYEQKNKQIIRIDLCIKFFNTPKGCYTDCLEDVICYASIIDLLERIIQNRRYKLIENLAFSLANKLLAWLNQPVEITLIIHKKKPLEQVGYSSFEVKLQWQK